MSDLFTNKLRRNKLIKLGLPPKIIKKLEVLCEDETIVRAMIAHYDKDKIKDELGRIESSISKLLARKEDVINNRLNKCDEYKPKYAKRLEINLDAQSQLILSHQSLAKLVKVVAELERLKALQKEMDEATSEMKRMDEEVEKCMS